MDPVLVAVIAEGVKAVLAMIFAYAQTQGLTTEQIEAAYQAAKAGMLERDPSKIPDGPRS